jgi:hypothetical protein
MFLYVAEQEECYNLAAGSANPETMYDKIPHVTQIIELLNVEL